MRMYVFPGWEKKKSMPRAHALLLVDILTMRPPLSLLLFLMNGAVYNILPCSPSPRLPPLLVSPSLSFKTTRRRRRREGRERGRRPCLIFPLWPPPTRKLKLVSRFQAPFPPFFFLSPGYRLQRGQNEIKCAQLYETYTFLVVQNRNNL